MTGRIDWPALMRAGLWALGLRPREFWDLTPAELQVMLGKCGPETGPMLSDGLTSLMAAWPDRGERTDDDG